MNGNGIELKTTRELVETWKDRTPAGVQEGEALDDWRAALSEDSVSGYVSALATEIRHDLARGSVPGNYAEAHIYTKTDQPMKVKIMVRSDSPLYDEAERLGGLLEDGSVEINDAMLAREFMHSSDDGLGFMALPYVADSLRRGELTLHGLILDYNATTNGNYIKATLEEELNPNPLG